MQISALSLPQNYFELSNSDVRSQIFSYLTISEMLLLSKEKAFLANTMNSLFAMLVTKISEEKIANKEFYDLANIYHIEPRNHYGELENLTNKIMINDFLVTVNAIISALWCEGRKSRPDIITMEEGMRWLEEVKDKELKFPFLDLSNKGLYTLPPILHYFKIEKIDLNNNNLSFLPMDFHKIKDLAILYLNNNKFYFPPTCLITINSLTHLNLKDNPLVSTEKLPQVIGTLKLYENTNWAWTNSGQLNPEEKKGRKFLTSKKI